MNENVSDRDWIDTFKYNYKWYRRLAFTIFYKLGMSKYQRPYSNMMCKFRLYTRFVDGRCQWCGKKHLKLKK